MAVLFILFLYFIKTNFVFHLNRLSPTRKLDGPLKLNTKLNNAERLFEGMVQGPESLVYYDGVLYTGLHGGLVAKIKDNQIIPFVKFGKSCGKTSQLFVSFRVIIMIHSLLTQ